MLPPAALSCLLLIGGVVACSDVPPLALSQPEFGAGTARFQVRVVPGFVEGSLRVYLDGRRIPARAAPTPGTGVLQVTVLVGAGPHLMVMIADFESDGRSSSHIESQFFTPPDGLSDLVGATPLPGAVDVVTSAWLELTFAQEVSDTLLGAFDLGCEGEAIDVLASRISSTRVVLNPDGQLPAGAFCALAWRGRDGRAVLAFKTAPERPAAIVLYDRADPAVSAPFPDDYWTVSAPETPTGRRLDVPVPERADVPELFAPLLAEVNRLDGFSPIAHLVVPLSDLAAEASLPRTPEESLDPMSTVALVDVDPDSASFGRRVPFRLESRGEPGEDGEGSHSILIFPSIPLDTGGRYGLLVGRRAQVADGRPLRPSASMQAVLEPRRAEEPSEITRARRLIGPTLRVAEQVLDPPMPREDLALALSISIGSLETLAEDMQAVRAQIFDGPPPAFEIDRVEPVMDPESPLMAVVHGTWEAPEFRDGQNFARDSDGLPVQTGYTRLSFTLTLPRHVLFWPAPVVMYQHGMPGTAEQEVPSDSRDYLSKMGFAVAGFTDVLNRRLNEPVRSSSAAVTAHVFSLLLAILMNEQVPDFWAQTTAEQLAFLRLIPELGALDLLPVGAPDGKPEIEARSPIGYVGISEGANHASALLPYAPEIKAAVLVAGGSRLGELLIHQGAGDFLHTLPRLFPGIRPVDVWVALALFQTAFDRQDAHNHARFLYRQKVDLADEPGDDRRRASVLLIAGLDDHLVPNHATGSLAWQLGPLPQLAPAPRPLGYLETLEGPIRGNIDAATTGAFVQFVPRGVEGVAPTPGCIPPAISEYNAGEGHFCAQLAEESRRMRANFLTSALGESVPSIGGRRGPQPPGASVDRSDREQ